MWESKYFLPIWAPTPARPDLQLKKSKGPKSLQLEVGVRRGPRFLVHDMMTIMPAEGVHIYADDDDFANDDHKNDNDEDGDDADEADPLICVGEAPWAPANSPAGRSLKKFVSCNWALTHPETCLLD